jgi:drug/metabolite transporter (DMT)-like permease
MNPTFLGLIAIGIWSLLGVLFLFVRALPPFEILAIVFFIGYLSYTALQLAQGEKIRAYWHQPLSFYVFWLLGPGLYTLLLFVAFIKAPIFEANILNYLWPILLVVFSAFITRCKLPFYQIAGFLMGFAGAVLMFFPERTGDVFLHFGWGHVFALSAAFVWALYSALTRRYSFPVGFQAPVFLVFSVICLCIHLVFEKTVMPDAMQMFFLVLLGLTRISYVFWDVGMKKGDVVLLASLSYFLPLISSVLLMICGEKPLNAMVGLSAGLIITGCLIVNAPKFLNLGRRFL